MEKSLKEIVRKTESQIDCFPGSFHVKAVEERLIKDFMQYRKGGLICPDGNGGVKSFSKEETKHICAPRIYAGIMSLARHGITDKAIKYALIFDKEFTLEHAHINQVYL